MKKKSLSTSITIKEARGTSCEKKGNYLIQCKDRTHISLDTHQFKTWKGGYWNNKNIDKLKESVSKSNQNENTDI